MVLLSTNKFAVLSVHKAMFTGTSEDTKYIGLSDAITEIIHLLTLSQTVNHCLGFKY